MDIGQIEAGGGRLVNAAGFFIDILRVVNDVHLVDGYDDMLDPQERDDERVALGLDEHAVTGVDEDDGQVGRRGAGRHIAGVLLVTGRIGNDEFAFVGGKVAV